MDCGGGSYRELKVGQGVYVPTNNFFVEEGEKLRAFSSTVPDKASRGFALFPIVEAAAFNDGAGTTEASR